MTSPIGNFELAGLKFSRTGRLPLLHCLLPSLSEQKDVWVMPRNGILQVDKLSHKSSADLI